MSEDILNNIKAWEEDAFTLLEQMVNIDSGNDAKEGIDQVLHLTGDFLENLGFKLMYIVTPHEPTQLVATRQGRGKKVMFIGHADTVFAQDTAANRAFKRENGRVYGPGVADMKGGVVATLFIIKALLAAGNDTDFTVVICGDEELSHPHTNAKEVFRQYAKGQDVCFCMEPGRENGAVVIGRKGAMRPHIIVEGKAAHAGRNPEAGINAIAELSHKIVELNALNDFANGKSVTIYTVKTSQQANTVPDLAECWGDVRIKAVADAETMQKMIQEITDRVHVAGAKCRVEDNSITFMPFETTPQVLALYKLMQKEAAALGQQELLSEYSGGCSDASWPALEGTTTLCAIGPQGGGAHTDSEYFEENSLVERMQLVAMTILHLGELEA